MAEPTADEIIASTLLEHRREWVDVPTVCWCGTAHDDPAGHAKHQATNVMDELALQGFVVVRVSDLAIATGQKGSGDYRDG